MRVYSYPVKLKPSVHDSLKDFLMQQKVLWNLCLEQRKKWEFWQCFGYAEDSVSKYSQYKDLTRLRKDNDWYRKYHVAFQRSILSRLDKAYRRFFKQGGHPRFKSRVRSFDAGASCPLTINERGFSKLYVKGIGDFRWRHDGRCSKEQVRFARIVVTPCRVKIQLVCDVDPVQGSEGGIVGIDMGIKERAVLSDGTFIAVKKADRGKLERLQRSLSRAQQGSNGRQKKKESLARERQRLTESNVNEIHRITSAIVRKYKYIIVEDLDIQSLTASNKGTIDKPGKNRKQWKAKNRRFLENNMGLFRDQLNYKAESAGGQMLKVDPRNTTQRCSECGRMPSKRVEWGDRVYGCEACGSVMDRDLNAARNVLQRGLETLNPGGTWLIDSLRARGEQEVSTGGSRLQSTRNRMHA